MVSVVVIPDGVQSVDARCLVTEKITPPDPLPHVSRRALARVRDFVPVPSECPYCGGEVQLTSNAAIYGREFGDWPFAYVCFPCDAYVGLHPHTDLPLGTLANGQLRDARKKAKAMFHRLLDVLRIDRKEGYPLLARAMGIDPAVCHFGMFDLADCRLAFQACRLIIEDRGEVS